MNQARSSLLSAAALMVLFSSWGCSGANTSSGTYVDVGLDETADGASDAVAVAANDLPCDVVKAVERCQSCHGPTLAGSASFHLLSRADFLQPSSDPAKSMGVMAVERMGDTASPMPPGPAAPATAAEIAALKAWVDGGMPAGTCAPVVDPFAGPSVCTSGTKYSRGTRGGSAMYPGRACITCHVTDREAPTFVAAGTVFPTAHEPDDCVSKLPTTGGAVTVVLTDANLKVYRATVNSSGNFYFQDRLGTFKTPYTAKVTYNGKERIMAGPQDNGDCNSCHTQAGTSITPEPGTKAPGRILLP